MKLENEIYEEYEIRDVIRGTVTSECSKGLFLTLENGEKAYAKFGYLPIGTKVLCSVFKKANKRLLMTVFIDSIIDDRVSVA